MLTHYFYYPIFQKVLSQTKKLFDRSQKINKFPPNNRNYEEMSTGIMNLIHS